MAPELFTEDDRFHQAQPETAGRFGEFHRQPSLFGHGGPQEVVQVTGLVGHLADPGDQALVIEKRRGRRLQGPLVVGELEIHGRDTSDDPASRT